MIRQPLLEELALYLRLARVCRERMQLPEADRFLTIAGSCAWMLGLRSIGRLCRQQILGRNPGHQVARFGSFGEALHDPDFQTLLGQLVKKHPPDWAEEQLRGSGLAFRAVRSEFASDTGYAAAAMGIDPEWLEECFGDPDG
jgi:hypothetical protein